MRKFGLIGAVGLLALALVMLLALRSWGGPGPLERNTTVIVREGSSLGAAARELEAKGAIRSATNFLAFARVLGGDDPIRSGEYTIPATTSASDVLKLLQGGRTLQRFVIVPEGMPSILVHERLMAEPLLTGTVPVPAEGSVLPDSYSFERGEPRAAVLKRMQDAMTRTMARLWPTRKPHSAVKTPREALTLASIVEKETSVESERRTVAAVYSNRLKIGMPLQADPTIIYPLTRGKPLGRRILRSEIQARNGYNTYSMNGLPVGPIANPRAASIAAVLDPAPSEALYFVAAGSGGHVFANTLAEHNANVARWYAIRRARGEM